MSGSVIFERTQEQLISSLSQNIAGHALVALILFAAASGILLLTRRLEDMEFKKEKIFQSKLLYSIVGLFFLLQISGWISDYNTIQNEGYAVYVGIPRDIARVGHSGGLEEDYLDGDSLNDKSEYLSGNYKVFIGFRTYLHADTGAYVPFKHDAKYKIFYLPESKEIVRVEEIEKFQDDRPSVKEKPSASSGL